jgi:hypothetical protein
MEYPPETGGRGIGSYVAITGESPLPFVDFVPHTDLPSLVRARSSRGAHSALRQLPARGPRSHGPRATAGHYVETGVAELVAGAEAGAVVPPRDPIALAEALRLYLLDSARAGADGRRARNVIETHCSPDRVAAKRELAYEEAVLRWRATLTGRILTRTGQRLVPRAAGRTERHSERPSCPRRSRPEHVRDSLCRVRAASADREARGRSGRDCALSASGLRSAWCLPRELDLRVRTEP